MKSMTGFGRGQAQHDGVDVEVEIRAVNNKGLDVKLKTPRELAAFEAMLLKKVRAQVGRGRVDVSIRVVRSETAFVPSLDADAADRLLAQLRAYCDPRGLPMDVGAKEIMRTPSLFATKAEELDEDALLSSTNAALEAALAKFIEARRAEGEGLKATLLAHIGTSANLVDAIETRVADAPESLTTRLKKRLSALEESVDVDPARIAQEVALLADRVDVTEEVNRLRMHETHTRGLLDKDVAVGRKLDFLCQEFLREANTIASKCQDATAAHLVVDLKSEVEKFREQVQNVE